MKHAHTPQPHIQTVCSMHLLLVVNHDNATLSWSVPLHYSAGRSSQLVAFLCTSLATSAATARIGSRPSMPSAPPYNPCPARPLPRTCAYVVELVDDERVRAQQGGHSAITPPARPTPMISRSQWGSSCSFAGSYTGGFVIARLNAVWPRVDWQC